MIKNIKISSQKKKTLKYVLFIYFCVRERNVLKFLVLYLYKNNIYSFMFTIYFKHSNINNFIFLLYF